METLQRIPLRYRLTCEGFTSPLWLIPLHLRWCNLTRQAKWFIVWSTDYFCHWVKCDIRIKWPAARYVNGFISLTFISHHISLSITGLFGYQFSQFWFILRRDVSHVREWSASRHALMARLSYRTQYQGNIFDYVAIKAQNKDDMKHSNTLCKIYIYQSKRTYIRWKVLKYLWWDCITSSVKII